MFPLIQLEAFFKDLETIYSNALTPASQAAIARPIQDLVEYIECTRHQEEADWSASREEHASGVWH